MQVILEQSFLDSARKLPQNIKTKLGKLLARFETNPYHPLLHTKKLTGGLTGYCSFKINREWRVLFRFEDPNVIRVLDTAHRRDIYR